MEKIRKINDLNIYFIGIGGISMSAIARFCMALGAQVEGSDMQINFETRALSRLGVPVFHGHSEKNLTKNYDYVVFSGAIHEDNVELKYARLKGLNIMERSEFLGELCGMYESSVVVTGTHGKTTTTALVGEILIRDQQNPSVHLGGEASFGNAKIGNKKVFVTEGCEYRNSIRFLRPNIGVITNIELDHTDFYKDLSEIKSAFSHFAENVKDTLVVFENNDFVRSLNIKKHIVTVGFGGDYDIVGSGLRREPDGSLSFDVHYGDYIGRFRSKLPGVYNAKNCLTAIAVGLLLGVKSSVIYTALLSFKGVKRRMERVGEVDGVPVFCDYAHHPTEIKSSISAIKDNYKRVLCIFQPHTFSRTIGLKDQFVKCFDKVDKLVIYKTYPAREKYIIGGSARELYNDIKLKNKTYCDTGKNLRAQLKTASKYDVVLVLGAGDIYDRVLKALKALSKT